MRSTQRLWILVVVTINLLAFPAVVYSMFYDLDLHSIPQNGENVISEILLGLAIPFYLYTACWLRVICFPVSQEIVETRLQWTLVPIEFCTLVAFLQSKLLVMFVSSLVIFFVYFTTKCTVCMGYTESDTSVSYPNDAEVNENTPLITP